MLLQDFNYFFNKAINQYINKRYNIYDINQQTSDDLRVLKATSILDVTSVTESEPFKTLSDLNLFGATYEVILPSDYLHLLNCICVYKVKKPWKCHKAGDTVQFAAKRLTADSWAVVFEDYYNRPLPERPYFYIHNTNINSTLPTNPISNPNGTDISEKYDVTVEGGKVIDNNSNFKRKIILNNNQEISTVDKDTAMRYGNASNVRMEIRCGCEQNEALELVKVFVDYLKTPQTIRLTQAQVNLTVDTSQILEFPDYVCHEIINELTMLVMQNNADPRLQTNSIVTQSIANPAQQQAPQPQAQ